MEDDTRFGIGVWLSPSLWGPWSEPEIRTAKSKFSFGGQERVISRRAPALLVSIDGELPLVQRRTGSGERFEQFGGLEAPKEGQTEDVSGIIVKQITQPEYGKAEVSNLTFHVISARGEASNSAIDNKGLVQVVLVETTEEKVEELPNPGLARISGGWREWGAQDRMLSYGSPMRGATKGAELGIEAPSQVDSTLRGETALTNTKRQNVAFTSIAEPYTPLAVLNMVLVGSGGPITSEMSAAEMPGQPPIS